MFDRKHLARACEPGLDFVDHEHDAVQVAQFAQLLQKLGRRDVEATFAHDRLDDDRRDTGWFDSSLKICSSAWRIFWS